MIDSLLIKARADTEVALGNLELGMEIYQSIREVLPQIAGENLLRLSFLLGKRSEVAALLLGLDQKRQDFWKAVFDAAQGSPVDECFPFEAESTSDLAYLGLLYSRNQEEKACQTWLHYLEMVEVGWERAYVSEEVLKRRSLTCQMCQVAPAAGFQRELPVCSQCGALLEDPDWFKAALKGEDSNAIQLLENLSGETFDEPFDMDEMFPHQIKAEATPLMRRLEEVEDFYPHFSPELKTCWDDATDFARRAEEELKPGHLWEVLHRYPDSLGKYIHKDSLQTDRDLYKSHDGEADLLRILNIARWWDGLNPNGSSSEISLGTVYRSLAYGYDESHSRFYASMVSILGIGCNALQAAEFERLLEESPDDIFLRLVLTHYGTGETAAGLNRHTLWLVNHQPHLAEGNTAGVLWLTSPQGFRTMLEAWIGALERNPSKPMVLAKAGGFFTFSQPLLALKLYQRAAELEPEESLHRKHIAHALEGLAREALNPMARNQLLLEATEWCERSLEQIQDPNHRSHFLVDAVSYAFRAEDWTRVESFAKELLDSAGAEADWNRGNSLHCAHLALGHLALNSEDREQAKFHLLAAGEIEGSPQLKSFGPHFGLARRLLALGEMEVVSQYLRLCQNFWDSGQSYLEAWLAQLKAGQTPDLNGFRGE